MQRKYLLRFNKHDLSKPWMLECPETREVHFASKVQYRGDVVRTVEDHENALYYIQLQGTIYWAGDVALVVGHEERAIA
jgi:hypothetical protein